MKRKKNCICMMDSEFHPFFFRTVKRLILKTDQMSGDRYHKIRSLFTSGSSSKTQHDDEDAAGRSTALSESPSRSSLAPRSPGVHRDRLLRLPVPLRPPGDPSPSPPPLPIDPRQYSWKSQVLLIGVLAFVIVGGFQLLQTLGYKGYDSMVSGVAMHSALFVTSFARCVCCIIA